MPDDSLDVDNDTCLTEKTPDLDRSFRINYGTVDIGAYEFFCPGDGDENGAVDVFDLLDLLDAWGPCSGGCAECRYNSNRDGASVDRVDVFDLLDLLGNWGQCDTPPESVPQTVEDCLNKFDADTVELEQCIEAVQGEL